MDGRKSTAEIAKEIGVPKKEVYKQCQEMKKAEIIKGATIHINYKSFGYKTVATLMANVDPAQADQFVEYARKMPETYVAYDKGPKGNIVIVAALKTLQQLNDIKESIKGQFSISELKTLIWTDVKEMHTNLALAPHDAAESGRDFEEQIRAHKVRGTVDKSVKMDEVDFKIAEKLSENGLAPLEKIAQEIGVAINTVKRRYEKLKNSGVLKVTIQVDLTKLGYQAMSIFEVTLKSREESFSIIEKISKIPDVISIMKTSGDYDLQIYMMIRDINHLLKIQEDIAKIQGITKMEFDISRSPNKWPTPRQHISTF